MERKPIGQKLSNLSALIQKQQPNKEQQDEQDEKYTKIFPNMNQPQNQDNGSSIDQDKLKQVQNIIQDQKQFQDDISKLLDRLGKLQESTSQQQSRTPSVLQQQPPSQYDQTPNQTPNNRIGQSASTLPKQITPQQLPQPVQLFQTNSPINDQTYRNLKEQNVDLLRQVAQLQPLVQVVNELKGALQQTNDRIREQQKQIEQFIKENMQLKQQAILNEQEKINNKRQFDDILANNQLAHQRDMQAIKFQAQENLNGLEQTWKQQYVLLKTESEAVINNLNAKLAIQQKDNQKQQDIINNVVNQNKEIQHSLQDRINDLNIYHQALEEKKLEYEKLQNSYNTSLEKYEINTKQLINQYSQKQKQQEQIINELKQHNTILSQQMVELDQTHKQTLQSQQIQVQHHINGKLEEVQKISIVEKQQLQQFYEDQMNKLSQDKESHLSQQKQSILFLEQKIAILVQENKTLVEQMNKIKKKADNLEQAMLNQEAAYQNLTKDSQYKTLSLTKQIQELNSMIGNSNQNNFQNFTRKSDTFDSSERIQQLEQQLSYKKEEMDLLLHHLDQVFEINRDFENKIKTLQAQLELMEEKNNREQDQGNILIKQQKQYIEELKSQLETSQKLDKKKESQIKELYQKLNEEEQLRKKQGDQIMMSEKQQFQEQIKQLKIKNVELINYIEILEQNQKELQEKYDQAIIEQSEQKQRFEDQKQIIEQQIQMLQKKNLDVQTSQPFYQKRDLKNNDLEKQMNDKDQQIKLLEQKLKENERKIKDFEMKQKEVEDIENQNNSMQKYYENKIKELELRIGTYEDQVKINNKQLSIQQAKFKNLEQQLIAAEDDISRLNEIKQNLEKQLTAQINSNIPSSKSNGGDLQKLQEINLHLTEQIDLIKKEKLQQSQKYESEIISLQDQNSNNLEIINQLKKEKQQISDNLNNKIINLQQQLDNLQKQISSLKQDKLDLNQEYLSLNEQNKILADQVSKLKKEKAQMTMKLMNSGMANLIGSQVSQYSEKNL
ncbi:unnamed protein product [Paramecium sonneborni]|uniref:Uncharacterized protein n=1 Tax=Paramecium sonneborni TaxID=65129 RepID=A0A8S1NIE8_9CILI|nr:unnamed protein product [Paramecium sonneborni]